MRNTTDLDVPSKYHSLLEQLKFENGQYEALCSVGYCFIDVGVHKAIGTKKSHLLTKIRQIYPCKCVECRKIELKNILAGSSLNELYDFKEMITKMIKKRERSTEVIAFSFEATSDPKTSFPFVARLFVEDDKLQRQFYELNRNYGKDSVSVSGTFHASEGDIIERRWGSNHDREFRDWSIVSKGELHKLADIQDDEDKERVMSYLKKEISYQDIMK